MVIATCGCTGSGFLAPSATATARSCSEIWQTTRQQPGIPASGNNLQSTAWSDTRWIMIVRRKAHRRRATELKSRHDKSLCAGGILVAGEGLDPPTPGL